jgi:hypothetical protein
MPVFSRGPPAPTLSLRILSLYEDDVASPLDLFVAPRPRRPQGLHGGPGRHGSASTDAAPPSHVRQPKGLEPVTAQSRIKNSHCEIVLVVMTLSPIGGSSPLTSASLRFVSPGLGRSRTVPRGAGHRSPPFPPCASRRRTRPGRGTERWDGTSDVTGGRPPSLPPPPAPVDATQSL